MPGTNESTIDRDVRIVLGVALIILTVFFLTGIWQIVTGVLSLVMLGTAAFGFCPLYAVLGINTCQIKERR